MTICSPPGNKGASWGQRASGCLPSEREDSQEGRCRQTMRVLTAILSFGGFLLRGGWRGPQDFRGWLVGVGIRGQPQKDVSSSSVPYNLLDVREIPICLCGLMPFLLHSGTPKPRIPRVRVSIRAHGV